MSSKAKSTLQDRQQPEQFQPDALPPITKIIECSCSNADSKSSDNSSWTNILREPITIKKGSEIRVQQSALDMTGIDSDIIQFDNSGLTQNNSHTILTQHYTTNDGINGKTCSYDYMGQNSNETTGLHIIDCGQNYTGTLASQFTSNTFTLTGSGTGFISGVYEIEAYGLRPQNFTITNGGSRYTNGAKFKLITSSSTDFYEGFIQTDDFGTIVNMFYTKPTASVLPTTANLITFLQPSLGSGLVVNNSFTTNALKFIEFYDTETDLSRGENYYYGDQISVPTDQATLPVIEADRAIFSFKSITGGNGQPSIHSSMDSGYNYEKVPISRWSHTYDLNEAFSFGNNLNNRTFLSESNVIGVNTSSSHQRNDPCLSAGDLITNKEDEFCSGIFHETKQTDQFTINAPILYFESNDEFLIERNLPTGWKMIVPNTSGTINGTDRYDNPLNSMPIGSTYQILFKLNNVSTPTNQQEKDRAIFSQYWENTIKISSISHTKLDTTITFNEANSYQGNLTKVKAGVLSGFPLGSTSIFSKLEYNTNTDGGDAPTQSAYIQLNLDGAGNLTSFDLQISGLGHRKGMTYYLPDYPTLTKFIATEIDNQQGWDLPASRSQSLTNIDLTITSGGIPYPLDMYLAPRQQYDDDNTNNKLKLRLEKDSPTIQSNFPVSLNSQALDSFRTITNYVSNNVSNGLYRNQGLKNSSKTEFDTYRGMLTNHDDVISFQNTGTNTIVDITASYGNSGGQLIQPFGNTASATDPWYENVSGKNYLRITKATWDSLNISLPINRYVQLTYNTTETHIQTGGLLDFDATFYYILIIAQSVQKQDTTTQILDLTTETYMGLTTHYLNGDVEDLSDNLNGYGNITINMKFIADDRYFNSQISLDWETYFNGSIAMTSASNFFGSNDIQYQELLQQNAPIISNTSDLLRRSYNQGGHYYLSKFFGIMTTQDGTLLDYDFTSNSSFNQGYDNFILAELPSKMYSWRSDYTAPNTTNYNQSYTNIHKNWDYYPLYREKTITIDSNFCVATDISGIWNNQTSELQGAIDPTTGNFYTTKENSGILQNEFTMPIYGSNNLIGDDGLYIKDNVLYANSGGLEQGHCIGKAYLQKDCNWMSGNTMRYLPEDANGKYYNVYFRTPFTKIRNYDPLATKISGSYVLPDRTPLSTVNLTADKIGNSNDPATTTKKALNGDTMLIQTGTPATEASAYELGESDGVLVGGIPVKFGSQSYYPIYYLDDDKRADYPKAKLSQFSGSNQVALVFDTSISTFTFQYLHQPFTSQFIDGQGGVESVRVFFGNRKEGILNHDTLGGLLVINYARPNYPRNTFTRLEVSNNLSPSPYFPNGIDPFISTSLVGRKFLNKLGFSNTDLGLSRNNKIDTSNTKLNYKVEFSQRDITALQDFTAPASVIINVSHSIFYGTTGSNLDTSDSIISLVPSPESSAGIESHNQEFTPYVGRSRKILKKFGDFIFYPYGINSSTNSFSDTKSVVRFDNATSTFGAVGGQLLSNSQRGMGIPNILGSLSSVDDSTIPVQLNPDALLYTSYTIQTGSSIKKASSLPIKFNHGYLLVLSSLMKQENIYMSKIGFVNAMSIINKTFLTGDFILSQGELQFYAQDDFVLSEITTTIRDSNFSAPNTLGQNSSVIYSITDYQPTSDKEPLTIPEEQMEDEQIAQMINEHINYKNGNSNSSSLQDLQNDFYSLGLDILTRQSGNIIQAVRNQINTHDLPSLNQRERNQFLQTDEGKILLQNATDIQMIKSNIEDLTDPSMSDLDIRATEQQIQDRNNNIIERTPEFYFQQPQQRVIDETPRNFPYSFQEEPIDGREIIQSAGYKPEDIKRMEDFARRMKFGEKIDRNRYRSRKADMIFDNPYSKRIADGIADEAQRKIEEARARYSGEQLERQETEIRETRNKNLERLRNTPAKEVEEQMRSSTKKKE